MFRSNSYTSKSNMSHICLLGFFPHLTPPSFPLIRFELFCFPGGQLVAGLSLWKQTVTTPLQLGQ